MRPLSFLLGLALCSAFALVCTLVGFAAAFYEKDCFPPQQRPGSYSVRSDLFPPGTRCEVMLSNGATQEHFAPVSSGYWLFFVASVAVGTVPLTILFRYKAAQDEKRGGPSF